MIAVADGETGAGLGEAAGDDANGASIGGMSCATASPGTPIIAETANSSGIAKPNRDPCILHSRSQLRQSTTTKTNPQLFTALAGIGLSFDARHASSRQCGMLAARQRRFVEIVDQLVKQPVPIDLGL